MLWSVVILWATVVTLVRVPSFQSFLGEKISGALSETLGTEVYVGRVNIGFFNRLILDDVLIKDQDKKEMLKASRMAVNIDLRQLTKDKVRISALQLFGVEANIYKKTADSPLNCQFAIDSLSSKDSTNRKPLDIVISTLVIRNGTVAYNILDKPETPGIINPDHIKVADLNMVAAIDHITDDIIKVNVKKMSFNEQSGLNLTALTAHVTHDARKTLLTDVSIELPQTNITVPELVVSHNKGQPTELKGNIYRSKITPSDLAFLKPTLKSWSTTYNISATANGTAKAITVDNVNITSSDNGIELKGSGAFDATDELKWHAVIDNLHTAERSLADAANRLGAPTSVLDIISRLGTVDFRGKGNGNGKDVSVDGQLSCGAGKAVIDASLRGQEIDGHITTPGIDLKRLSGDSRLGMLITDITIKGRLFDAQRKIDPKTLDLYAKGTIDRVDFNNYSYQKISLDGTMRNGTYTGLFNIDDPNGNIHFDGSLDALSDTPGGRFKATIRHFDPHAMQLTTLLAGNSIDADIDADIRGKSLNDLTGNINIQNLNYRSAMQSLHLDRLTGETSFKNGRRHTFLKTDFAKIAVDGEYDYATLGQSITNLISNRLPTLPGIPPAKTGGHNNFNIDATLYDTHFINSLTGIDLNLDEPLTVYGSISDDNSTIDMTANLPAFSYNGGNYEDCNIVITSPGNALRADGKIRKLSDSGNHLDLSVNAIAQDNSLLADVGFNNNSKIGLLNGLLRTQTEFLKDDEGENTAHITIHRSELHVGDSIWEIEPSDIIYRKNNLYIDHFAIDHHGQHIIVSGFATGNRSDSITVDMQGLNVSYLQNLANFHSVNFDGKINGQACIKSLLNSPDFSARLRVDDFRFQNGRMGVLYANVGYDKDAQNININAVAQDKDNKNTLINGYIAPARNAIDLDIKANGTRLEFMETFCKSFMRDVDCYANGRARLWGKLKGGIMLTGELVTNGTLGIKSLTTRYALHNDTIRLLDNDIVFINDSVYDGLGGKGVVNGALHHTHLAKMSYDIKVKAQNMLAYDFKDYGDNTFFGTVFATGECDIKGRIGDIRMDITGRAEKGSFIEYNAASPSSVGDQGFIRWNDITASNDSIAHTTGGGDFTLVPKTLDGDDVPNIPSDMRLNFLFEATPDFTLRVLMDQDTKDVIALNGNGTIRANYFNKGSFEMFGNYLVDHGIYKMTIQNIIKKDFIFQNGSTIVFGGDPYNAALNLKAQYTVNGVSLSDLQVGKSFKSNNIRVNCLMNITGTPLSPTVDFDLDMPSLSADAQQMIRSLMNSEEDMNQQVLYLLAIGRFYTQGNNENEAQQSQTSLAMQSLLSGTISQQINNVLSSMVNNSNWNFGANISTGDEGWNNAEYEGLLSGRLLNNRLLINGQFGYRDNANATTSFIGDFDIRYLLMPSGDVAIKVYNQTNDRYFTKSSLNTQGVGLVLKRDFNNVSELFKKKKKKGSKRRKEKK